MDYWERQKQERKQERINNLQELIISFTNTINGDWLSEKDKEVRKGLIDMYRDEIEDILSH